MSIIDKIKNEISELTDKLENSKTLSAGETQIIIDQIAEKKRQIELESKLEKNVTPVKAPTMAERRSGKKTAMSSSSYIL